MYVIGGDYQRSTGQHLNDGSNLGCSLRRDLART